MSDPENDSILNLCLSLGKELDPQNELFKVFDCPTLVSVII